MCQIYCSPIWNYNLSTLCCLQATHNLIVLAKEEAGAEEIYKNGGVDCLMRMADTDKERDLRLTAVRVLACMSKNSKKRVCVNCNINR